MLRTKMGTALSADADTAISAKKLINLKQKVLRHGLWFKTLNRLDRVLIDLTIKVKTGVHINVLANGLLHVTQNLQIAFESKLGRFTRDVGFQLSAKFSQYAQQWGNKTAQVWATGHGFAKYLAAMSLNGHPCAAGGLS